MGIVAVHGFQRKSLLAAFEKHGATSIETAVTVQEICEKWDIGGIDPMRSRSITENLSLLVRKGKIQKTENEKYYLSSR